MSVSGLPGRIIFDLTTSARSAGPQGGIVQAERGLGGCAPQVSSCPVVFSVYDTTRAAFFLLRPELVSEVLEGGVLIEFPEPGTAKRSRAAWIERARWVIRNPGRYLRLKLSRIRGLDSKSLTRGSAPAEAGTRFVRFDEAVDGPVTLSASDVVVSCGADWHGKDVFAIGEAKARAGFFYVGMCYDIIPWRHPQYWPRGVAESVVSYHAEASWLADLVMCISHSTADEYAAFCDELDLVCPRLEVFRLADDRFQASGTSPSPASSLPAVLRGSRYVLMVGSIEPRKNHRLIYEVWDELVREQALPDDVKLVFAGAHRWMTDDLLQEIALNRSVADRIVIVRSPDESELQALYERCLFLVMPSFQEGWGLPVAESLSHGKICLASNRGALSEISELAILLDIRDFRAWKQAILEYVTDEDARQSLEGRIRNEFRPRRWPETTSEFIGLVEQAFAER